MILINLLPHREARRKRRKSAFFAGLMLSGLASLGAGGIWYLAVQQQISAQQDRNGYLRKEIVKLDEEIKDVAALQKDIDSLKARQKAVEDLQIDRNIPVYILNELVKKTPEGIYLASVRQDGQVLTITGISQSNERVSEFLRNTGNQSEWLVKPELIGIKANTSASVVKDQKRLFDFSVRVSVKRPQAPGAAASAPATAVSTPPAAAPKV
ncbi:MAG: PilN domain-containing protein [Pseudomonadota bacterium]